VNGQNAPLSRPDCATMSYLPLGPLLRAYRMLAASLIKIGLALTRRKRVVGAPWLLNTDKC
jgi:hypothetical protein